MRRVAIVTGAARGIGEATARALARDGHTIALADLNVTEARRTATTLPGGGHTAFAVDVADESSVEALFEAVEAELGPVAVLACVAGGPLLTPGRRPTIIETTAARFPPALSPPTASRAPSAPSEAAFSETHLVAA